MLTQTANVQNTFNPAAAGGCEAKALSSLRQDAERFVSEISRTPEGTAPLVESLAQRAWAEAVAAAKEQGRRPRQSDAIAALYTCRDQCMHGLTM